MLDLEQMKKYDVDATNYMAIELLEQFKIYEPTQEQIEAVELFIAKLISNGKVTDKNLPPAKIDNLDKLLSSLIESIC